jgi:hypothetical protein
MKRSKFTETLRQGEEGTAVARYVRPKFGHLLFSAIEKIATISTGSS